jgi:hypothetical protein
MFRLLKTFRSLPLILIFPCIFLLGGHSIARGKDVDNDWIKIKGLINQKKYSSAESAIDRYIQRHSENRAAYILGGRIARKYNLPEAGIQIVDKGIKKFHFDATLLRLKAELLMEKGELLQAKIILSELFRKLIFHKRERLLSAVNDQVSENHDQWKIFDNAPLDGKKTKMDSSDEQTTVSGHARKQGYEQNRREIQAREVNILIEEERKQSRSFLLKKESLMNGISSVPNPSGETTTPSVSQSAGISSLETEIEKVQEDFNVLKELALSVPPLSTFDQNINFQQIIPPPDQVPEAYTLENNSYHLRLTNVDLFYTGGASIGLGVAIESPLIWDTVHFQTGTNEYLGSASGQGSALASYTYAGVDGGGPDGIQYLLDAGNVNGGGEDNVGLYSHVNIPFGPVLIDGQGWYQLPWSSYGQALLSGGLHSGTMLTATWNIIQRLSLSGEYEFTYDTLHGSQIPFGFNHNTMITMDWGFLKTPDLHLVAGYDSQNFASLVPYPSLLVPVLQSSSFWSANLSTLDPIGRYVVLNGQMGGIYGKFGTLGPMPGFQADGGLSMQITPRFELYGNISYESLAASYVGPVTTMMYGINIWF